MHVLDELGPVTAMRSKAKHALATAGDAPIEALAALQESCSELVKKRVEKATHGHRKQKQSLTRQLREVDQFLGTHGEGAVDYIKAGEERERRREQALTHRKDIDARLLEMARKEQERWAKDRGYEEYTTAGTCCRAFFEDVRDAHVYSHIEKIVGRNGYTYSTMKGMLSEARRYYGDRGSIFNLQRQRDAEDDRCRGILLRALRQDKRVIPERLRAQLSVAHLFEVWNVQYAIEEMASHKAAGDDGIPADWYKVVGARRKEQTD